MNVNNLLEDSSPYQVLSEQSAKLAGKWERSGLLEGIESSTEKNNMSMLLENQAKQLVNEANSTGGQAVNTGTGEAWAGVALPLVRRVFGEIVAKDLVSVQPMNLPSGLIFYLDFQYGTARGNQGLNESIYGAAGEGVDTIKRTSFEKGLYGAGEFGYSIQTASGTTSTVNNCQTASATLAGILNNDTEFSASYAGMFGGNDSSAETGGVRIFQASKSMFTNGDFDAVRAWKIKDDAGLGKFFPQFTRENGDNVEFVISGAVTDFLEAGTVVEYLKKTEQDARGDYEDDGGSNVAVSNLTIPEINVQMVSDSVTAKTRKLKAQWTPEFAQDLNAYHSIDAEAELTSILSEYISMEIDLEILDMLIANADTVEGWSAAVAKDVSVNNTSTSGGSVHPTFTNNQNNLGVYYTKMSWFQTLGIKLQKVSNLIHQKTLRGGANFMVVSPKVSTILESIPGFAADSSGDQGKYAMGVQKIGAINSRYTVYKNPYMTENVILMGYKGSQFLETGAVFAPYIPLIMTPLVYDPTSFTPRKGIMTRYAKKMVRPDFYGKVLIQDLNEL